MNEPRLCAELAPLVDKLVYDLRNLPPGEALVPARGSPAQKQLDDPAHPHAHEALLTGVSYASNVYVATVDHLDTLAAVLYRPTLMGIHLISRVGMESSARLFWHCEPGLSVGMRVERVYSVRESAAIRARTQAKKAGLGLAEAERILREVKEDTDRMNVPRGSNGGVRAVPKADDLVHQLMDSIEIPFGNVVYSLASELSHSEPNAIYRRYGNELLVRLADGSGLTNFKVDEGEIAVTVSMQLHATAAALKRLAEWFGWPHETLNLAMSPSFRALAPHWTT